MRYFLIAALLVACTSSCLAQGQVDMTWTGGPEEPPAPAPVAGTTTAVATSTSAAVQKIVVEIRDARAERARARTPHARIVLDGRIDGLLRQLAAERAQDRSVVQSISGQVDAAYHAKIYAGTRRGVHPLATSDPYRKSTKGEAAAMAGRAYAKSHGELDAHKTWDSGEHARLDGRIDGVDQKVTAVTSRVDRMEPFIDWLRRNWIGVIIIVVCLIVGIAFLIIAL